MRLNARRNLIIQNIRIFGSFVHPLSVIISFPFYSQIGSCLTRGGSEGGGGVGVIMTMKSYFLYLEF